MLFFFLQQVQSILMKEGNPIRQSIERFIKFQLGEVGKDQQEAIQQSMEVLFDTKTSHQDFEASLSDGLDIAEKKIKNIFFKAVGNQECLQFFGLKILRPWLKYKIIDAMELKLTDKKTKNVINSLAENFSGECLDDLLKQAVIAQYEENDEDVVKEICQKIMENTKEMELFKKQKIVVNEKEMELLSRDSLPAEPAPNPQHEKFSSDKSIKQQLNDLISDFQLFPEGSLEKELQRQMIYHFQLINKLEQLDNRFISTHLDKIRQQYESQNQNIFEKQIIQKFDDCKIQDDNVYSNLCFIKQKLMPFNVPQAKRLIQKTKKVEELINDKNIFLLIGSSGSGKSTCILKFLGYKLVKALTKELFTLRPTQKLAQLHETFYTSPFAKSCTRYINSCLIPRSMFVEGTKQQKCELYIVDSPGFDDSGGAQIDAANLVGTINALRGCKSIKIGIILPKDSLFTERMGGTKNICSIVSNLFFELKPILPGLILFFNKFQKEEDISQLPLLIKDKLQNLNPEEKSDQKLKIFLNKMMIEGGIRQNFIDPRVQDFRPLLDRIVQNLKPISKETIRKNFQYNFSDNTKQKIEKFNILYLSKLKNKFRNKNYKQAKFCLEMLIEMKNILNNNDNAEKKEKQAKIYIAQQIQQKLKQFQKKLKLAAEQLLSGEEYYSQLKILEQNIRQMLSQFRFTHPNGSSQLQLIKQSVENNLMMKLKDGDLNSSSKLIESIKKYTQQISQNLKIKIIDEIRSNYKIWQQNFLELFKTNLYQNLGEILIRLKYFSHLYSQFSSNKDVICDFKQIQKLFKQKISQTYKKLNDFKQRQSLDSIKKQDVQETNKNLLNLQKIQNLNVLENNRTFIQQRENFIKEIQEKCRVYLKQLTTYVEKNDLSKFKQSKIDQKLVAKKTKIDLLKKISSISEAIERDYQYTFRQIQNKFKESVEFLRQMIKIIRRSKDQMQENIQNFVQARQLLKRCFQILGNIGNNQQKNVTQNCDKQLLKFLNSEYDNLKCLKLNLFSDNNKDMNSVVLWCGKINIFTNLESIEQLKNIILKIKNEFCTILLFPFEQFAENSKHFHGLQYNKLCYNLDIVESICQYSNSLKDILNQAHYNQISLLAKESTINDVLIPTIISMKEDLQKFFKDFNQGNSIDSKMKQLIMLLCSISQKKNICKYLTGCTNAFDPMTQIKNIQSNLNQSSQLLSKKYQLILDNREATIITQVLDILKSCNAYIQILQHLPNINKSIKFQQLKSKIQDFMSKQMKNDQEKVHYILSHNKTSSISFSQLQQIYLKPAQNKQIKKFIAKQLSKLSKNHNGNIQKLKESIQTQRDLFMNSDKLKQSFQIFSQAKQLSRNLNQVFKKQENISIDNDLLAEIQEKYIEFFIERLEKLIKNIEDMNLNNCKENINIFGQFQSMLNKNFKGKNTNEKLKLKFKNQSDKIKNQILLKINEQNNAINQTLLKALVQRFFDKKLNQVQLLYRTYSPSFTLDEKFIKFYDYQSKISTKCQQQLNSNIQCYYQQLFTEMKEANNKSEEEFRRVCQKISDCLKKIPHKLTIRYKMKYNTLLRQIQENFSTIVQKLGNQIKENPENFKQFFSKIQEAYDNRNLNLYDKLIAKLQSLLSEKQGTISSIQQRKQYILSYYIINLKNNHRIAKNHQLILQKFTQHYNNLIDQVELQMGKKQKYLRHKINNFDINFDYPSSSNVMKQFFQIVRFSSQLKSTFFQKTETFQKEIRQLAIHFIKELYQKYNELYGNIWGQSHKFSIKNLEKAEISKFKKLISLISQFSLFINDCRKQINHIQISEYLQQNKQDLQKISSIKPIQQKYQEYQMQIVDIVQSIQRFQFYNDVKKNYEEKNMEEDIINIRHKAQLLIENKQFFDKFFVSERKRYNIEPLKQKFTDNFIKLFEESQKDIELSFCEPNIKCNNEHQRVFFMYCKIIIDKRMILINDKECKKLQEQMQVFIKQSYDKLNKKIQESLKQLTGQTIKYVKELKQLQNIKNYQRNTLPGLEKSQIYLQKKQLLKETKMKIQEQISKQTDKAIINTLDNKLKQQTQSLQNQIDCMKDEEKIQISKNYDKNLVELKERLKISIKSLGLLLMTYKKVLLQISYENTYYQGFFGTVLHEFKLLGPRYINFMIQFLDKLQNDNLNIGRILLNSCSIFQGYLNKIRLNQTRSNGITYVLQHIKKIGAEKQELQTSQLSKIRKEYIIFNEQFRNLLQMYKKSPREETIQFIVRECKEKGKQMQKQIKQDNYINTESKRTLLLSYIFALWAIIKCQRNEDEIQYPIEPHPAQICALIVLLGLSTNEESMKNRFAQVLTGEGKSLILAGLSCYLALIGYDVKCACYSLYLSQRDYQSFKQLFKKLNVETKIQYNTFNVLCQNLLNKGNLFSQAIEQFITIELSMMEKLLQKFSDIFKFFSSSNKIIAKNPNEILIIDQLDMLFDETYFGNTYCPSIELDDQTIKDFLMQVWKRVNKQKQKIKIKNLLQGQQFKRLKQKYPNLKQILKNQVYGMVAAALNYKHPYYIIDQSILYKDNDSISPKISYGYRTVFANIYQYQNGKVSWKNCCNSLKITLMAAQFSYAMLPMYYKNILGVTGTLKSMPQFQKKMLKDKYNIEQQYSIPSAFGMQNRRIQNYQIVTDNQFYGRIVEDIEKIKDNRPIIIFFKDSYTLNDFFNSEEFKPYIKRSYSLTEEHPKELRQNRIFKATEAGRISLMTSSFGRGTDFVVQDNKIKAAGGLHIIHAYLSTEESDQIQIKGRTARQKNPGSYTCIINQKCLEELQLIKEQLPPKGSSEEIHNILLKARQKKSQQTSKTIEEKLIKSTQKHNKIINIFQSQKVEQNTILQYTFELNKCPEMKENVQSVKTVLGIDATGSMRDVIAQACLIVQESFERVYQILKEKKIDSMIQIKIMVYRNYSSGIESLLESSAFQNTAQNLRRFLKSIKASGGQGNQAIQVFMQEVNKQVSLSQVILIGDAAANTQFQTKQRRNAKQRTALPKNSSYWNSKFPQTNMQRQMSIFQPKKVPIHSFYLGAKQFFKDVSLKTEGECKRFDIKSKTASDDFTQFIVTNVLKIIGNQQGSFSAEELIKAYMDKYKNTVNRIK